MDVETSLDIEEMRRRIQQGINRCCEQLLEIAMILTHKGGQVLNRLKGASFPELAQNSENIGNGSMSENQNQRLDPMTSAQYTTLGFGNFDGEGTTCGRRIKSTFNFRVL